MRLRRGIAVSLLAITYSTRVAPRAAGQSSPPPSLATSKAPAAPARLNTAPMSRFELQRLLGELDERRRRLRTAIEPADSVLRLLSADTAQLLAVSRPPEIVRD